MADPAVEHVQQREGPGAVGRHGHRRRRHGRRDGIVGGHALGHHAGAQVAVGQDPEPLLTAVDDHARRPGRAHLPRRVADRRLGRADHERAAHERLDGLVGWVGGLLARRSQAPAVQQRARQVAQGLGPPQGGAGDVGGDEQARRLLVRAHGEAGGQARQHRGLPEQLAHPEQVERAPVEDELDGAAAHDPQVADGLGPLGEDRGARGMVLELGRRGDARRRPRRSSASNGG